jgi:hypothetical protein
MPVTTPNPWTLVPAADYEAHMGAGPGRAGQLGPLAFILARALRDLRPESLLVLGVATGNGLEAVDPEVTRRVVGLDVNMGFLAVARQRHMRLGSRLELYCKDVERAKLEEGAFALAWAGLFLEHVNARDLAPRLAASLAPGGSLVAALQLPDEGPAAVGPIAAGAPGSIRALAAHMRLVPPEDLDGWLQEAGLVPRQAAAVDIGGGRRLHVARWLRPK